MAATLRMRVIEAEEEERWTGRNRRWRAELTCRARMTGLARAGHSTNWRSTPARLIT